SADGRSMRYLLRALVFFALLAGNAFALAFFTLPSLRAEEKLEAERQELSQTLDARRAEAEQYEALQRLLEVAEDVLQPQPSAGDHPLSDIRSRLLEAEEGLGLERISMDLRPESAAPAGHRGFRIRLSHRGEFSRIYEYLHRLSRLKLPLAPVEMTLAKESGLSPRLLLKSQWLVLWLEGSR
ncbi:MAG: hypothetical protein ACE5JI_10610, partial [Acidobacteriota bacterium]